jgi:hypothetical protein
VESLCPGAAIACYIALYAATAGIAHKPPIIGRHGAYMQFANAEDAGCGYILGSIPSSTNRSLVFLSLSPSSCAEVSK